jgi:hypothetical protein
MDMIVDDIDLAEQYQTRDEQGNITGNTLGSPAGVNSSEFFRKDIAVAIKATLAAGGKVTFCPVGTYEIRRPSYNAIIN